MLNVATGRTLLGKCINSVWKDTHHASAECITLVFKAQWNENVLNMDFSNDSISSVSKTFILRWQEGHITALVGEYLGYIMTSG